MGFRVAPILPNNLDGRKRLAIQESDAANHAIIIENGRPEWTH
jgi:hypothetical protein